MSTSETKRKRRRIVGVIVLLALAALLIRQVGAGPQPEAAQDSGLEASGIIQAEEVSVASEFGGRIVALPMAEGDSITAGDVLLGLDTTLLDAQIEAARAAVVVAEAGLAQAQAGARPGQIAVAEAQLAQAEAARTAATQAVSDTLALVENPQDIRLQSAVTQAQAEAARLHVAQAQTLKDAAEIAKNEFENAQGMEGRHKVHVRSGPISDFTSLIYQ